MNTGSIENSASHSIDIAASMHWIAPKTFSYLLLRDCTVENIAWRLIAYQLKLYYLRHYWLRSLFIYWIAPQTFCWVIVPLRTLFRGTLHSNSSCITSTTLGWGQAKRGVFDQWKVHWPYEEIFMKVTTFSEL